MGKTNSATDARTQFVYNAYIYGEKHNDGRGLTDEEKKFNKPSQAVIRF